MLAIEKYGYLQSKCSLKEVALMLTACSDEIFFPVLSHLHSLIGEVSRQCLEEELKSFGYAKHSAQRNKLLKAAKRELIKYKRTQTLTAKCNIQQKDETTDAIYIANDEHFDHLTQVVSKSEEEQKANANTQRHRWDERGYLKMERERTEWIHFDDAKWMQHLNISPVTVIPTMPISQIYTLFHVLRPDKIYVAKMNKVVGVIDEQMLLER